MNSSHGFDRPIYDCPECGATWYGDAAPTGLASEQAEECPQCGAIVKPTVEPIES